VAECTAAVTSDPDPRVRAAALGALVRSGPSAVAASAWTQARFDPAAAVRRRAADLAPDLTRRDPRLLLPDQLLELLGDPEVTVVEAAAWALGELADADGAAGAVARLAAVAVQHGDPIAREAAVGALGAMGAHGHAGGLDAILAATTDKPAVRRRAVLALASFGGARVDAALAVALGDRDWQVRQAAEDLISGSTPDP
jgi:HEAT repeat protein